jgi:hypothetical protein
MERITFATAKDLNISAATDAALVAAWHAYASQISYHHADDSTKEWGQARALMPRAREIEVAIRDRGLERPTGDFLMSESDRIDWETGEWSRGWHYAKQAAERANRGAA